VEGDPVAFGTLFTRHRDRLWAVALRTTGDPEEAADALQDAMVSAFRRADTFRGDSAVTTWLHRIVVNACLDRLRRLKVRRADALPDGLADDSGSRSSTSTALAQSVGPSVAHSVGPSAALVDPAQLAVDHERRAAVLAALATLPLDQRAALVLVDMEGYSVQEVAAILDCAPGTVKSRCSRGRARLLPLLLEHRGPVSSSTASPSRSVPSGEPGAPGSGPGPLEPAQPGNPHAAPRVEPARRPTNQGGDGR
jgi:RNA polymerase sigma-70 factor (ECF subfamily)